MINPKKILVVSINAGGGHIAAMNSIADILVKSKAFKVDRYIIQNSHLDNFHKNLVYYFPVLYELLYNLGKLPLWHFFNTIRIRLAAKINRLDDELIPIIKNIDVVISTHFMITEQLLRLRDIHDLDFKIINYIPDFDKVNIHKVNYKGKYCDGYIAQSSEFTKDMNSKNYNSIVGRFIPSSDFQYINKPYNELLNILNKDLSHHIELDFSKPIICITGGALWAKRLLPRLKKLWRDENINKSGVQYIVITGRNESFYSSFEKIKKRYPIANIQAVPFLNSYQLSALYNISSIVLLASIAPASLYEIGAIAKPIVVLGRKNPGQEYYNAQYAEKNNLIIKANGKKLLYQNVLKLLNKENYQESLKLQNKAFKKERLLQKEFAEELVEFVGK